MIGAFQRRTCGVFVYRSGVDYVFYRAQGMIVLGRMPLDFNIWSQQLGIWALARWGGVRAGV